MKKKIFTLIFGLACMFLFATGLRAEAKVGNINSTKTLLSIEKIKNNASSNGNTSLIKYGKLKQLCESLTPYTCSEAMEHVGWAAAETYIMCDDAGWGSETCAEWVDWFGRTVDWAIGRCLDASLSPIAKPRTPVITEFKRVRING